MDILQEILGLPQLTIERAEVQETEIHLYVKRQTESAICPQCRQECRDLHQNAVRVIRDLPLSGRRCYLHVHTRRFWCPRCALPVAEPLDWVEPYRNDTTRYQAHIYELVRQNNITYVETLEGLSYEVVERIFLREAHRRIPAEPFQGLRRLGIDEIAERKGRNAYDLIFTIWTQVNRSKSLQDGQKSNSWRIFKGFPQRFSAGLKRCVLICGDRMPRRFSSSCLTLRSSLTAFT